MNQPESSPRTTATTGRIAYLDNARYWVMLLVVVGHSLTQFTQMDSARGVYVWIYLFHMPLFILISGHLAKSYRGKPHQVRRLVSTLVVPYLLVEASLQIILRHYTDEPERLMLLSPQWLAWFLAALFIWRLTTPIWHALRYPIATSIAISLLVGLIELPNVLALPKVLGFLPFYVIGLKLTREHFERLADIRIRITSAVLLGVSFVICYVYSQNWTIDWLLWKQRYDEDPLGATALAGITQRAELLVIGLVLTAAALSLIPRHRSWYSAMGERTLYAYLLHGYVILILRYEFGLFHFLTDYGAPAAAATIVGAAVLGHLLMTKVVARIFRPLFEPRLTWLFRTDDASPTRPPKDAASTS